MTSTSSRRSTWSSPFPDPAPRRHSRDEHETTTAQPTYGELYEDLSAIAPVISYETELLADSGDDLTRMIGRALGEEDAADELIGASHAAIADFVADHPGLDGKTYALGQHYAGNLQLLAGADTPSAQFLAELGLTVPGEIAHLDSGDLPAGMVSVSPEQVTLLDTADTAYLRMYGAGAEDEFMSSPLVPTLRLSREGALHVISDDLISLLFAPNPAVTDLILDDFGPLLEQLAAQ